MSEETVDPHDLLVEELDRIEELDLTESDIDTIIDFLESFK